MISFVIPINERKMPNLPGAIYNISELYNEAFEIIISYQIDTKVFKLGPMRNLGFKQTTGDIVVFFDVDMRLPTKVNFRQYLDSLSDPFLAWDRLAHITEDHLGQYKIVKSPKIGLGQGGCIVFSPAKFKECHGYSNLVVGWGKEDEMLARRYSTNRFNYMTPRINNVIYHVQHPTNRLLWGKDMMEENNKLFRSAGTRDPKLDSYRQTIGYRVSFSERKLSENQYVRTYKFKDVGVVDDFEYMDLYRKLDI